MFEKYSFLDICSKLDHPSNFCTHLIQLRIVRGLGPIPTALGQEAGYTLCESSITGPMLYQLPIIQK